MFWEDTGGQQAGDNGVLRIADALACPAYEGVAMLAQGLLGCSRFLHSTGTLMSESPDPRVRDGCLLARARCRSRS
jgi:hypothetical protein